MDQRVRRGGVPVTLNIGFTGNALDRVDHLRTDDAAVAELAGDWRARVLILDGLEPPVADGGGLRWSSLADVGADDRLILLGLDDRRPHFALLPATPPVADPAARASWVALATMPGGDAAIFGTARSLVDWHARHGFCARCGTPTAVFRAGWGRRCDGCRAEHYPRVDPVVIMLAEHEGHALVGRQSRFPAGRYSALAGFVEPGESMEEAVARELFEEAGVRVSAPARYVASQPWPFPAQLMIAAIAPVADAALTLDVTEIEDAMWVTRDEVRTSLADDPDARFIAPPPFAIAHSLLTAWVSDQALAAAGRL